MNKKLKLSRETVRVLDSDDLRSIAGGLSGQRGAVSVDYKCPDSMAVLNTCISQKVCDDTVAYPSAIC